MHVCHHNLLFFFLLFFRQNNASVRAYPAKLAAACKSEGINQVSTGEESLAPYMKKTSKPKPSQARPFSCSGSKVQPVKGPLAGKPRFNQAKTSCFPSFSCLFENSVSFPSLSLGKGFDDGWLSATLIQPARKSIWLLQLASRQAG